MEAKHTPGPWFVPEQESADLNISIKAPDPADPDSPWNVAVAIGACGHPDDQTQANARLIASAPALVEALKEVMGWIDNWYPPFVEDDEWPGTKARINAALSQALGGE